MFRKFTNGCVAMVQKFMPDPFLFCVILSFVAIGLAMPLTGQGFTAVMRHWGNGFWGLLPFSMQMALVLVLGNAMATSPPISRFLKFLASIPKTPTGMIVAVTVVGFIASWVNWGFGLVVGALYAREIAKTGKRVDYRLLIASAYIGFISWHGGFSGSVPLQIAMPIAAGAAVANTGGAVMAAIPISQTIFAPFNWVIIIALFILMPFVNSRMHPKDEDIILISPELLKEEEVVEKKPETPAEKLENSRIVSLITGALGVIFLVLHFTKTGVRGLDLNAVNFIFLISGILLHGTPIRYVRAITKGIKGAGGILLQFPFYAGIAGIMGGMTAVAAGGTGQSLAMVISNAFANVASPASWPLLSFLSCFIVNFFIPSGGGQWAVQGPVIMPAGAALGVMPAVTAMTYAWADTWGNMIAPFWALPALGIAGLGARDIMGYCVVALVTSGVVIMTVMILLGQGLLLPM